MIDNKKEYILCAAQTRIAKAFTQAKTGLSIEKKPKELRLNADRLGRLTVACCFQKIYTNYENQRIKTMNREIKFRGKTAEGKWVYGDFYRKYYRDDFGYKAPDYKCECVIVTTHKNPTHYDVLPETVGQFTGLHDKGGKEIYEGDIIRIGIYSCIVYWCETRCAWGFLDDKKLFDATFRGINKRLPMKLIGNTHEDCT